MLNSLLCDISKIDDEKLLVYLRDLNLSGEFKNILNFIISKPDILLEISKSCYLHANGFVKISLGKTPNNYKLRVHIWSSEIMSYSESQLSIHDHPWSFFSTILHGEFVNTIYHREKLGDSYIHHTCEIKGNENHGHTIKAIGEENLEISSQVILKKGSSYYQQKYEKHQAFPKNDIGLTATLVIQTRPEKRATNIYLKNEIKENVSNKKISSEDIKNIIIQLIEKF